MCVWGGGRGGVVGVVCVCGGGGRCQCVCVWVCVCVGVGQKKEEKKTSMRENGEIGVEEERG